LTNDDKYIITTTMKNNNKQSFSERFTMNNALTIIFAFVSLIPVIGIFIL